MLEKQIQASILRALNLSPLVGLAWRNNTGAMKVPASKGKASRFIKFGEAGMSDILGVLKTGQFFAIEVKQPEKKATALQQAFIDNVNDSGGRAGVATSVDEAMGIIGQ